MKLSIGIVGLPNVGKSTLFKLLTKQDILVANYPFATIDPNVGIVPVPDERLEKLNVLSKSKKKIPAVVEFYDIAGLVKGASTGEGLGNQFLTHIRETQAVVMVLRVFESADIIHVENSVDPLRDLEILNTELALKDLETVEKRLAKAEAEARTGKKEAAQDKELLAALKTALEAGTLPVSDPKLLETLKANTRFADMNLLTAKRQIYLLNGEEKDVSTALKEKIKSLGADFVVVDLATAEEDPSGSHQNANHLPNPSQASLRDAFPPLGKGEELPARGGFSILIKKAYQVLNLESFFTTGEDETRAWTIEKGTKAPQAAGVIHTDFEQKFIRLEVVACDKLLEAGGWSQAKQKGWMRLEGKEYVVQDGDVVVVRHG